MNIPNINTVSPGDPIRADDWNKLIDWIREAAQEISRNAPIPGPGILANQGTDGTVISAETKAIDDGAPPADAYVHPFKVSAQLTGGNVSAQCSPGTFFGDGVSTTPFIETVPAGTTGLTNTEPQYPTYPPLYVVFEIRTKTLRDRYATAEPLELFKFSKVEVGGQEGIYAAGSQVGNLWYTAPLQLYWQDEDGAGNPIPAVRLELLTEAEMHERKYGTAANPAAGFDEYQYSDDQARSCIGHAGQALLFARVAKIESLPSAQNPDVRVLGLTQYLHSDFFFIATGTASY